MMYFQKCSMAAIFYNPVPYPYRAHAQDIQLSPTTAPLSRLLRLNTPVANNRRTNYKPRSMIPLYAD